MVVNEVKKLFKYKDLFIIIIWKDFSVRYRQSIFGLLWAIFQPLSLMCLFTFVFTFIMPLRVSSHPFPLFFYSGLLLWLFFSSSIQSAISTLMNHYNLVTKIYFPREILPLSVIAIALIDFLFASLILICMLVYYRITVTLATLWFFPLLLLLILFTISVALILSALNAHYRDVSLVSNFLINLWFFATPIFYSLDHISPEFKIFLYINPLTYLIENMRNSLINAQPVVLWEFVVACICIFGFLYLSYKFFKIAEKRFVDVL